MHDSITWVINTFVELHFFYMYDHLQSQQTSWLHFLPLLKYLQATSDASSAWPATSAVDVDQNEA